MEDSLFAQKVCTSMVLFFSLLSSSVPHLGVDCVSQNKTDNNLVKTREVEKFYCRRGDFFLTHTPC